MQIERKIQRFDFSIFPNLIFKNFPLPRGLESHALENFFVSTRTDKQHFRAVYP